MNPLLLKPKADDVAQLIVHGKAVMDVTAKSYFLSDELQGLKLNAILSRLIICINITISSSRKEQAVARNQI